MLDDSTRDYILSYFSRFMTAEESAASMHYDITQQFSKRIKEDEIDILPEFIRNKISKDPAVLALLKDGIQQFRINTAERIFKDSADKIYFNNCPKCNKLARTPEAKQCRYCGHSWHNLKVGKFEIISTLQIIDGPFYIIGDIVSGRVERRMRINLTVLGLGIKPVIASVETIVYRADEIPRQCTALALSTISEENKELLKSRIPFELPVEEM